MANLLERRVAQARIRAGALRAELDAWRARSAPGQPLALHHSQVRRIAAVVEGLLERVTDALAADTAGGLTRIRGYEERLLTAHTLWDFFRSKLAQRLDPSFSAHLRLCDDLAWQCYAPARERFQAQPVNVGAGYKEPPLVFLNAGWSPFAQAREAAFAVDRLAGGWLATADFRAVIEHLPVPLIGLPWYQATHLPDVLVAAHEVGHVVEWDFGLRTELAAAIAGLGLPEDQAAAWQAWQPEVFADLYGCLACGPAFAAALIDFFAVDNTRVAAERRTGANWGLYPPTWLRVQVLAETLNALGRPADAQHLAARWTQGNGAPTHNGEFADDAAGVAAALLDCPCRSLGVKVREILPGLTNDQTVALNLKRRYAADSEDSRVLVAAARRLWEDDPDAYVADQQDERIRGLIRVPVVTRGSTVTRGGAGTPAPATREAADHEAADRQAGRALFDSLFADGD